MTYIITCLFLLLLAIAFFLYEEMAERKNQFLSLRDQIHKLHTKNDSKEDVDVIFRSETDHRLNALELSLKSINASLWPPEKEKAKKKAKVLKKAKM